jgi:hypothetical protein
MAGWGRLDSGRERILGENGFWARTDSGRERILGENGLRVKIKMKTSAKTAGAKRRWLSLKQEAMKSGNPLHGFMASCFIYFQTEPLPAKRRWLSLKQEAMKSGNPLHGFMASCFIYFQTEPLPAKRR